MKLKDFSISTYSESNVYVNPAKTVLYFYYGNHEAFWINYIVNKMIKSNN